MKDDKVKNGKKQDPAKQGLEYTLKPEDKIGNYIKEELTLLREIRDRLDAIEKALKGLKVEDVPEWLKTPYPPQTPQAPQYPYYPWPCQPPSRWPHDNWGQPIPYAIPEQYTTATWKFEPDRDPKVRQ